MSAHAAEPVGGRILTPAFKLLALVAAAGLAALVVRYSQGLGASSGMTDGYAWGIWIAIDVVVGTAVGCGGYAMALLVYIANRGEYHPLVRPAMLTGALGYTFAATSILIDVGRYWGIWKIPTYVTWWNFDSALLEVALCVMTYVLVLWLEFSPAVLESLARKGNAAAAAWRPRLDRAMPWIIAAGLLLPTMHQSSLGTVMMLPASKVHPLWHTSLLPLLFLVNCVFLGYAAVVAESTLAAAVFRRPRETKLLGSLGPLMSWLLLGFVAVRLLDVVVRGRLGLALSFDRYAFWFWVENLLALVPAILLRSEATRASGAALFRAATLVLFAGVLYRFDTYILAYDPGPGWNYWPSLLEMLITAGLVSMEIMIYVVFVKRLPVLAAPAAASR